MNKVILIGNLGADVETRYTQAGKAVANFRVATNRTMKDSEGNKKTYTEWHRLVAWGKLAEICGEHLSKGDKVGIEGELRTRSWEDKDGNVRSTTEIILSEVEFLSNGRAGSNGNAPDNSSSGEPEPPALTDQDIVPF